VGNECDVVSTAAEVLAASDATPSVALDRPTHRVRGEPLRLPLRLEAATLLKLEGTTNLPEYRFDGRYGRQYHVLAGVDFGRPRPTEGMLRAARAALHALVLPRWIPRPQRCRA
jgi:hypothetical protein